MIIVNSFSAGAGSGGAASSLGGAASNLPAFSVYGGVLTGIAT